MAYAMSIVSQFMHSPKTVHLKAIKKILRSLKFTPWKRIPFKRNEELSLEAYFDADWTKSLVDRRSMLGYSTILGREKFGDMEKYEIISCF